MITNFIATIYEWFGYNSDLGTHLRGWDITCSNFAGTDLYLEIFLIMLMVNVLAFILMYLLIDRFTARFSSKGAWWIIAFISLIINFGIAYSLPLTVDQCGTLVFGSFDLVLFGFANSFWSLIVFALLTSFPFPRNLSTNCRLTTFWKP